MTTNRRRQLVVNKPLQRRIILATAWAPGLCLAIAALVLGVFCFRLQGEINLLSEALQGEVQLPGIVPVFIIAVCFMLVGIIYILFPALQFSHRIAGPTFNIRNTLRRFRDGDIDARIKLRDDDYLVEIQDYVNEFLDWLERHPPKDYVPVKTAASLEVESENTEGRDTTATGASPREPEVAKTGAGE